MANVIRNKFSAVTATPPTLLDGELAYSENSGNMFVGTGGGTVVQKIAGKVEVDKLALVEANADVTDAANVDAAGAVMETDYNANTILSANVDNTPLAITIGASTIFGRASTGDAVALTAAQARTILNVEDGSTADQTAAEVVSTPAGDLAATDVQTALNELDTEKVSKAGSTMTGLLVLSADPSAPLGAATKQYVDGVAQGLDTKDSVKTSTTANITLSGEQTLDGILTSTDRVLVMNQTAPAENGIYVTAAGAWTRATDLDTWSEMPGAFTFIEEGTTNADTGWVCTSDSGGTLETTAVTFAQFSGAGTITADGLGIEKVGSEFQLELDGTTLSKSATGVKVDITAVDHDGLLNFVALEHLDWTADQGASNINDANIVATSITQHVASIDHDATLNFVADEHIAHSGVTLTAGVGLTGGGTIAASRTFDVDVNGLTADATPDGAADYVMSYDASATGHKKVLINDLLNGGSF